MSGTVGSAQGGKILTTDERKEENQGYLFGRACRAHDAYKLALEFVAEQGFCDDTAFDHSKDCYYLRNNCHIEKRGGHRYLRPSLAAKLVLKQGAAVFNDASWLYSYHGTAVKHVASIIKNGLTYPGAKAGPRIARVHGGAYGDGVYTSKLPLYSQLYAKVHEWRGKFVQVLFLVRQRASSVEQHGCEGCYTAGMIGRTDVHRLYDGHIKESEVQFVTKAVEDIVLQALLVKIHDTHPGRAGGEYYHVAKLLDAMDGEEKK